jgi:hypothetical protein
MCVIDHLENNERFEQELRHALRPVAAPEGFADRVMQRAESPSAPIFRWTHVPRLSPALGLSLAACALLALVLGGEAEHRHRESLKADRQFALAMQVTNQALEQAAVETRMHLGLVSTRFPMK